MVVPLLGSAAVVATFFLGSRIGGATCGLLAAMLLSTSPIFLFQLREPMSDVPVTAWWLLATLCAATATPARALLGGLLASAAIGTGEPRSSGSRSGDFVLGYSRVRWERRSAMMHVLRRASCQASRPGASQQDLYGFPLVRVGSTARNVQIEYRSTNLLPYPRWLIESETP